MTDQTKPALTRACPLCGGAMKWCGDVPITDVDPKFAMETHVCHMVTCTACSYNVDFHGIPEDPPMPDDEENGFGRYLQKIADKWNAKQGA
jgi:hypothetical protein